MASIGIVANVYMEANALPGWIEMATSGFFDDVQVYHAGPGGAESTDGTIELLEKANIPIHRGKIDEGFGIVRTAAVRATKCDWAMLLDADERFYTKVPRLTCHGESTGGEEASRVIQAYDHAIRNNTPSNWENLTGVLGSDLRVDIGSEYDQGAIIKSVIEVATIDAIATIRRHWHDLTFTRPTQNWHHIPDVQMRIVRNTPSIHFNANTKMHEQLIGARNPYRPNQVEGPFFDHYHFWFKAMEPEQRKKDLAIYDALHFGHEMPKP